MNMRQSRIRILLLTLLFMLAFVLVACGSDDESVDNGEVDEGDTEDVDDTDDGDDADVADGNDEELFDIEDFPTRSEEGEVEEGGTLNFGLISDTAFEGLLNWNFYGGDPDKQVLDWFDESLLDIDENNQDRKSTRLNSSHV